jgi:hypothetical protein
MRQAHFSLAALAGALFPFMPVRPPGGAAIAKPPPPPAHEIILPNLGPSSGTSLTFTPDASALLYYDGAGIARFDLAKGETVARIPTTRWGFTLAPDGTRIANDFGDSVRIHDAATGRQLHALTAPPAPPVPKPGDVPDFFRAAGFGEGARRVFTVGRSDVHVWDLATGTMVDRIDLGGGPWATTATGITSGRR